MNEKPIITSVGECLELAKLAGFSLSPFIYQSAGTPISLERLAEIQKKVRAFGAFNLTPECLRPHIEEPPLPPKWGEPMHNLTVNKLGQG